MVPLTIAEGLPFVQAFVDRVPIAWDPVDDPISRGPVWWAFNADGKTEVIVPRSNLTDGDDAMDIAAAWAIAYVKTYKPVALVGVSQGYSWTIDPTDAASVAASDRYRSARGPMDGKRECLLAFVETHAGCELVTWPIEEGPRRPGEPRVSGNMTGRFALLMQKRDIHDRAVAASVGQAKLPLAPEPVERLRARFGDALTSVGGAATADLRRHIFDFEDGLRLYVSVEELGEVVLVVNAINYGKPVVLSRFEQVVLDHFNQISGQDRTTDEITHRMTRMASWGAYSIGFRPRHLRPRGGRYDIR